MNKNKKIDNSNLLSVHGTRKVVSHLSVHSPGHSRRSVDVHSELLELNVCDIKKYELAPEISHLRIHRGAYTAEDLGRNSLTGPQHKQRKCPCLFACFSTLCFFCRKSDQNSRDLDDLDPVLPRTVHSVDYIKTLADNKPSKNNLGKDADSKDNVNKGLLQKAFKAAYDGLTCLSKANDLFKQAILLFTFTQYSTDPLGPSEQSLIKGKTILGSYAWMATYILQQLQFDAELEVNGYPSGELKEVLRSHERCVCQSLYIWEAMIHTIEVVEQTHNYVEKIFNNLVSTIGEQNAEASLATTRHIKSYRKYQRRRDELDKLKTYDSKKTAQTWAKFSAAPLRILMKDERTRNSTILSWVGFDVQPPTTKFYVLKLLFRQIERISESVLSQIEQIDNYLHSGSLGRDKKHRNVTATSVRSFEDGVFLMNKYLEESSPQTWSQAQIDDFLEVDKISLDSLDLLTLSTATMRTLVHEARHILHVTYETTRDLDYLECKAMNTYEEIVESCRIDFPAMWEKAQLEKDANMKKSKSTHSLQRSTGNDSSGKKLHHQASRFDIEESVLESEDAEHYFERSIYQDVIKEIPVMVYQGAIKLTLQDAEAVFTESSHEMLSSVVHE